MSPTNELPAIAWNVLAMIGEGAPLSGDDQVRWARAFEQIKWVTMQSGAFELTKDGRAGLRDRNPTRYAL